MQGWEVKPDKTIFKKEDSKDLVQKNHKTHLIPNKQKNSKKKNNVCQRCLQVAYEQDPVGSCRVGHTAEWTAPCLEWRPSHWPTDPSGAGAHRHSAHWEPDAGAASRLPPGLHGCVSFTTCARTHTEAQSFVTWRTTGVRLVGKWAFVYDGLSAVNYSVVKRLTCWTCEQFNKVFARKWKTKINKTFLTTFVTNCHIYVVVNFYNSSCIIVR